MVRTIKTKEHIRDIKVLDKASIVSGHLRQASFKTREQIQESTEKEPPNQYAVNQISIQSKQMANIVVSKGKQSISQSLISKRTKTLDKEKIETLLREKTRSIRQKQKIWKPESKIKTVESINPLPSVFSSHKAQLLYRQRKLAKEAKKKSQQGIAASKKTIQYGKKGITKGADLLKKGADLIHQLFVTLTSVAGSAAVVIVLVCALIGGIFLSGTSVQVSGISLSAEVLQYTPMIQKYCAQYEIPEFVNAVQAIMMQESGGKGNDPMQCSECPYNEKYPNTPNGITDPEYVPHVMRYYSYGLMNVGDAPNFNNEQAWGNNNPYSRQGLYGQCTWFAWGRFYEIYGWGPSWTANGWDWVNMLVTYNSDQFRLSAIPDVGAVFSGIGHNHVGIVIAYDGTNITVQEGNLDGRTNTFEEAKTDWQTKVYTLQSLNAAYGGVVFAVKK
ncbi:CHAP domain-containing protein [Faecalicoccus pleomorphus]|uniref:CHAP domain-containing protein n=1 Tax=Faecalicoccus pleomorphus TaxID=1323 RepID=UPI00189ADF40|nr:CHAP domain-containing protein [Faecalicoccus pleomorphus]MDB7984380.1 CHAP domain-containing protein [Faecalicoccus pleomorphus]